ncbi:hypothetical protein F5Y17DRAFT_1745 [Xylariaceae sp. FL0594]|nr:hypothetical protein F5Y17DRAFT_1745 [Xylariaceae sp. FL0594]
MGRRPHPLIEQFFDRGTKLKDNSNRYRYRCKACGEWNEKGRYDSLIKHVTKICPGMTDADRINVCLAHHGLKNGTGHPMYDGLLHSGPNTGPSSSSPASSSTSLSQPHTGSQAHGPPIFQSLAQNAIWTPLETLAEVSRQIEASEKQDDHLAHDPAHDPATEAVQTTLAAAIPSIAASAANQSELQHQFTPENTPKDVIQQRISEFESQGFEELRLQQLLQPATSPSQTALSVAAAAATARLSSSLLDPHILSDAAIAEQVAQAAPSDAMEIEYPVEERAQERSHATPPAENAQEAVHSVNSVNPLGSVNNMNNAAHSTPWDGMTMTYMAEDLHVPVTVSDHAHQLGLSLNKGGYRMDTHISLDGTRHRHSRARFDPKRRREVQEVRRIGACIRCRILRKNCSRGTPCDTCKKVLSPRVWRTGCIRTKLTHLIDLYSAGVQVVMAQQRINAFKASYFLENTGFVVEASHFPETKHCITFQVVQGLPKDADENTVNGSSPKPVILLDGDKEDIPGKVEAYMRHMLPQYIAHEPSPYVRVTLELADALVQETDDELLRRSLELWGIVELMDRERQWTMLVKSPQPGVEDHLIKDDTESEAYSNICMQLTAAAERKAAALCKLVLAGVDKQLTDGKTKPGFPMFLTIMLFLNCLEKTTWAFKAWDQENLRPKWPLEQPPSSYTNQGHKFTELLRLVLVIRHVLPKTLQSEPDMPIAEESDRPIVNKYFHDLNITPRFLRMRYNPNNFQPTDSRSLEFLFCAQLLLDPSTAGSPPIMSEAHFSTTPQSASTPREPIPSEDAPPPMQAASSPRDGASTQIVDAPQTSVPSEGSVPQEGHIPPDGSTPASESSKAIDSAPPKAHDPGSPPADNADLPMTDSATSPINDRRRHDTTPEKLESPSRPASAAHSTDPPGDSASVAPQENAQAISQEVCQDV